MEPKELKFRATGRRVTVADLPKLNGRVARNVNLSMVELLMTESEEMGVGVKVCVGLEGQRELMSCI